MALTPDQLAVLAHDITANPAFATLPKNADGADVVKTAYNLTASPDFWVWQTRLAKKIVYDHRSPADTLWNWATFISQPAGEKDAWTELFEEGYADFALQQNREAVVTIFGTGPGAAAQRTHILAAARRLATEAEALFATGPGTPAAPATMTFEGLLTISDVEQAWAL